MAAISPACTAPACSLFVPPLPSNAYQNFLRSADKAGRFIVEFRVFPKAAVPTTFPSLPACAAPACDLGLPIGTPSVETVIAVSDHPFRTRPDDPLKPNFWTEARLASRVDIDSVYSIIPNTSNPSQQLSGDIELENADGWADVLLTDYEVDGRQIVIKFGPEDGEYSDLRVIESTFGKDFRGNETRLSLTVQDLQFRLDQQFQTATFKGTGGIEGDVALSGALRPRLYGRRFHFTPVMISAAHNIYMVNDTSIEGIVSVRDGGAELLFHQDATTYAELAGLTIPEGYYATALNLGLLRIHPAGGSLASVLGVEAQGYNTGGYVEGAGDILVRILRDQGGISENEIDPGSFAPLNAYTTGYYYDGSDADITFRDVIQQLTLQTNGRIIADDRLRAALIVDPSTATYNFQLAKEQIQSIEPQGVPYAPILNTVIEYKPNDTVLASAQVIDPATDAITKAELQRAYREVSIRNGSVAQKHVGATKEMRLQTDLATDESADALARAISTLWSTSRQAYRVVASREAMFYNVGSVVEITYPRYHFVSGRNALVVSKHNDYNAQQAELLVLV